MTRRKLTFILRHPLIARRHHKAATAPWPPFILIEGIEWCPVHHGVLDECSSGDGVCDMAFGVTTPTNPPCKPEAVYYHEDHLLQGDIIMTTNDNYIPVKGDRIRRDWWDRDYCLNVEYVGQSVIVGIDDEGEEQVVDIASRDIWIKVEPPPVPLPDSWYAVTPHSILAGIKHGAAEIAMAYHPAMGPVIAAIRLHTDENGVDHAEIIRSTPTQGE